MIMRVSALILILVMTFCPGLSGQENQLDSYPRSGDELLLDSLIREYMRSPGGWGAYRDTLAGIGEPVVDTMVWILTNKDLDYDKRNKALVVLNQMSTDRHVESLIEIYLDSTDDRRIRSRAMLSLPKEELNFKDDILEDMLDNPNFWVRIRASDVLWEQGAPEGIEAMYRLCDDPVVYARMTAMMHIMELNTERAMLVLIGGLYSDSWEINNLASNALVPYREMTTDTLIGIINDKKASQTTKYKAIYLLGKSGSDKAVQPLVRAYEEGGWITRNEVSLALASLRAPAVLSEIMSLIASNDPETRADACWILGELQYRDVKNHQQAGENQDEPELVKAADILMKLLEDAEAGWMAAVSLGKLGVIEAAPDIALLLDHNDPHFRRAAAWSLSLLQDKNIEHGSNVEPGNICSDPDLETRNLAGCGW